MGHFKGYELPLEYFLNLAWNTERWNNTNLNEFTRLWAAREFGATRGGYCGHFGRVHQIQWPPQTGVAGGGHLQSGKLSGGRAGVAEYHAITARAKKIYDTLPQEMRDAFYQLVLFPVGAARIE